MQDTIYRRLCHHARANPARVVVRDHKRDWTWGDLLARAAAYRDEIQTRSAQGRDPVAIPVLVDRTGETIAAILGVLACGRAFSPLSPDQPKERLIACLAALESSDALVLTDPSQAELGRSLVREPILPGRESHGDFGSEFEPNVEPESLLYVLFTSGSTGTPKGVKVSHANIVNTMLWSTDLLDWQEEDKMGNVAPFFFDISMFDLFTLFYYGVPLAIFSNPSDVHRTLSEVEEFAVTSVFSAPVFFSQFLRVGVLGDKRLAGLRRIISGGDFFPPAHILAWLDTCPHISIWNVWGPTETSIVNTMHLVTHADRDLLEEGKYPSVGREHDRMRFVLLSERLEVVPIGEPGEICMIGQSVTQGYLADEQRTRQSYFEWEGERAFHTNDIGFLDENGNLFMIGRTGSMVKIAGYRVDLGEVESAAARISEVSLAGAFVREVDAGIREIHLAVELKDGFELGVFELKQRLRMILPNYMVPKRMHILDRLPRSANGKINRRALTERFEVGP